MFRDWEELPKYMQNEDVLPYYKILAKKQMSLKIKRGFDFIVSFIMLILLLPVFVIIGVMIKKDSAGPVFFRQERITQYGRKFRIYKFRTMVTDAESKGSLVTVGNDSRITGVGEKIRKYRIDELPQLINIFLGDMSFVGTRPEVTKYVKRYTPEMMATLLMPAGVTSRGSINYMDEDELLNEAEDVDETYVNRVLPDKMKYNLEDLRKFSCIRDICIMIETVIAVIR